MSSQLAEVRVRLDGRFIGSIRVRIPPPSKKLSPRGWESLENRLSLRAMSLPAVRRRLERWGISETVFYREGVYEILTLRKSPLKMSQVERLRSKSQTKPVPKGFARLPTRVVTRAF